MADNLKLQVVWTMLEKVTAPLKKIKVSSGLTARALKETRDKLAGLNKQAKETRYLRKLQQEFRDTTTTLKKNKQVLNDLRDKVEDHRLAQGALAGQTRVARKQFEHLRKEMERTKEPSAQLVKSFTLERDILAKLEGRYTLSQNKLRNLKREFQSAETEVRKFIGKKRELADTLSVTRERMKAVGITTAGLRQHEKSLANAIAVTNTQLDAQNAKLAAVTRKQERMAVHRQRLHRGQALAGNIAIHGYAGVAAGSHTLGAMRDVLGIGYDFDASMSGVQAVTRIASKDDPRMQALRHQARTLPLTTKFTDSEVAQGQYFLGKAGYSAEKIINAIPGMLNMAAAGDLDLAISADIASNIQTAMGIPAENMGHVADVLTASFTRNNVDILQLGESLKYSAGVGREYGQSLETVTATTAILGNAGIQGSMAGTSMRAILSRIGDSKALHKLGVHAEDKNGNMRDMVDILRDIQQKTAGMGNIERGAIFKDIAGQYAVTAFGALMRAVGDGQLQQQRANLSNSDGEATKVSAIKMNNLKGEMAMLHSAYENVSVELFDKNSGWLRDMTKNLAELLHTFGEFLKEHPGISKAIVMIAVGFGILMAVTGALAIGLAGLIGPLLIIQFALSAIALLASPWLLIAVAVLTVIAVLYIFRKEIMGVVSGLWDDINDAFKDGFRGVGKLILNWTLLGVFRRAFATVLSWFGISLPKHFSTFGGNIIDALADGIGKKFRWLKDLIFGVGHNIADWFSKALHLKSSHTVLGKVDGPMAKALANGFDRSANAPFAKINKLSKRLTNVTAGIAVAGTGQPIRFDRRAPIASKTSPPVSYQSNDQYAINIHAAPGMDHQAIAATIRDELQRIERDKAARRRSSFHDRE